MPNLTGYYVDGIYSTHDKNLYAWDSTTFPSKKWVKYFHASNMLNRKYSDTPHNKHHPKLFDIMCKFISLSYWASPYRNYLGKPISFIYDRDYFGRPYHHHLFEKE